MVKVTTYAKINLSLVVYPPRQDGYHPLCSVFQNISLADEMFITSSFNKGLDIISDNNNLPTNENNILFKVYNKIKDKLDFGLKIKINKNIPIGAGLGGGSSNAAGFIAFLQEVLRLNFTNQELLNLALSIGADVPFFLFGYGTSFVTGIGEIIEPIKKSSFDYFLLLKPPIAIPTKLIYQNFDNYLTTELKNELASIKEEEIKKIQLSKNYLEPVVYKLFPEIKNIHEKLESLGLKIHLSGSGATSFIPFTEEHTALIWEQKLKELLPNLFIKLVKTKKEGHIISFL